MRATADTAVTNKTQSNHSKTQKKSQLRLPQSAPISILCKQSKNTLCNFNFISISRAKIFLFCEFVQWGYDLLKLRNIHIFESPYILKPCRKVRPKINCTLNRHLVSSRNLAPILKKKKNIQKMATNRVKFGYLTKIIKIKKKHYDTITTSAGRFWRKF